LLPKSQSLSEKGKKTILGTPYLQRGGGKKKGVAQGRRAGSSFDSRGADEMKKKRKKKKLSFTFLRGVGPATASEKKGKGTTNRGSIKSDSFPGNGEIRKPSSSHL